VRREILTEDEEYGKVEDSRQIALQNSELCKELNSRRRSARKVGGCSVRYERSEVWLWERSCNLP